jgi:hypothetical protein
VLKKAPGLGRSGSWPGVVTDLNSPNETEIELDGKRFVVRSVPRPTASLALRATGVAMPPTVREVASRGADRVVVREAYTSSKKRGSRWERKAANAVSARGRSLPWNLE